MGNKAVRWCSLIFGIIVLICGISLLFTPMEAYIMIAIFIPFAILFHGVSCIGSYFSAKKEQATSGWLLADGILSTIIGVWLLFRPGISVASLPFIFGFWVMFAGVLRIIGAITTRKVAKNWIWLLMWGIIGTISGIFLLNHPLLTGVMISYLVVWAFIFMGIQDILFFFVKDEEKPEEKPAEKLAEKPADGGE